MVKLSNKPSLLGLAVSILSRTSLSVETGITSIISLYLESSSTSCAFIEGIRTLVTPDSAAASILAVTPPTGNTCPLTLNEPVKATV